VLRAFLFLALFCSSILALEKKAKIFVAGHTGEVGSVIVRHLKKNGYHNLILKTPQELDLTEQLEVERFFLTERPEYVFLVATKGYGSGETTSVDFSHENLLIEANLIHASYKYKVKKCIFITDISFRKLKV